MEQFDNIHENNDEPEALGLSKALTERHIAAVVYMLDYVLPQFAKLSGTLQTERLESMISSLVNATLHTLDDSILPSAIWVLELLDDCKQLEETAGIIVSLAENLSRASNKAI